MKLMLALLGLAFGLTGCAQGRDPNTPNEDREACYLEAAAAYQLRTKDCSLDSEEAFDACEKVQADTWKKEQEACP